MGANEGDALGLLLGELLGPTEGWKVLGISLGMVVGVREVGANEGDALGPLLGELLVPNEGPKVVVIALGMMDGAIVVGTTEGDALGSNKVVGKSVGNSDEKEAGD